MAEGKCYYEPVSGFFSLLGKFNSESARMLAPFIGSQGEDTEYPETENPLAWIETLKTVADYTNADFNTAWKYTISEFFTYLAAHIKRENERKKMMQERHGHTA